MPNHRSFPVGSFVRASSLHVGAAAASAALRRDLVDEGTLPSTTFDEAYAVARLTPGTNLLAMYTLLGERIAGFAGALAALAVGTFIPGVIAVFLAGVYVTYSGNPIVTRAMQGARAGALAVFVWAIIRLIRPQLKQHRRAGVLVAMATLIATMVLPIPQFVMLLLAGVAGAILLRSDT